MSEIRQLIERLCPEGVEYRKLGEVCEMQRGTSMTRKNAIEGDIPVISGGREPAFYINTSNRDGETITVAGSGAGAGYVQYWNKPIFVNDAFSVKGKDTLLTKYVYYCMKNMQEQITGTQKGGGVPHVHISSIDGFEIPIPPLEVQRKIVEILDKEAELEARRKQYEYYRNQLLTFDKVGGAEFDVKWMTLGEIGEMIKGAGIQKSDFVEDGYPCIHYGQLHTYFGTFADKNKSFISKDLYDKCKKAVYGDLIIATTSEDVEACCKATAWLGDEVAVSGDAHIFHHNQNPKYVAYFFQTDDFAKQKRKFASGVKVVRVKGDNLSKILIPIPPLAEQERIVSILDRFEALTTDLQSGLPAEIAARRKQYEYYREQLLTFKRKTA